MFCCVLCTISLNLSQFEKITKENGALDKVKDEVVAYGQELGLSDQKIQSLIRENSVIPQ